MAIKTDKPFSNRTPEQIRLHKNPDGSVKIVATFGLCDTKCYVTLKNWRDWLTARGWQNEPRVWD